MYEKAAHDAREALAAERGEQIAHDNAFAQGLAPQPIAQNQRARVSVAEERREREIQAQGIMRIFDNPRVITITHGGVPYVAIGTALDSEPLFIEAWNLLQQRRIEEAQPILGYLRIQLRARIVASNSTHHEVTQAQEELRDLDSFIATCPPLNSNFGNYLFGLNEVLQ